MNVELVDLTAELSRVEDGIVAARERLDEVAALVGRLAPGAPMPATLGDRLKGATDRLLDLEDLRSYLLGQVEEHGGRISPTVPVRVYSESSTTRHERTAQ